MPPEKRLAVRVYRSFCSLDSLLPSMIHIKLSEDGQANSKKRDRDAAFFYPAMGIKERFFMV
jgi:hypothetical protein